MTPARRSLRVETEENWSQSLCAPRWQATIDGDCEPGCPIGHGGTEPEAVMDLYYEIMLREDKPAPSMMDEQ